MSSPDTVQARCGSERWVLSAGFGKHSWVVCGQVSLPASQFAELFAVEQIVEQENRAVENFGAVGHVLPRSEFLGRVADSVATGDEDHRHRRNLRNFLGVLTRLAGQIHGGKAERLCRLANGSL